MPDGRLKLQQKKRLVRIINLAQRRGRGCAACRTVQDRYSDFTVERAVLGPLEQHFEERGAAHSHTARAIADPAPDNPQR